MKSILNLAVINFRAKWGDKAYNLERIKGYLECAGKRGMDIVVLPEMCLTGYDDDIQVPKAEKMQIKNAETKEGAVAREIAELAKQYKMYCIVGMPEQVQGEYNNAGVRGYQNDEIFKEQMKLDHLDELESKNIAETASVYNSALIAKPNGAVDTYQKIHLALNEPHWAEAGEEPCLIETPWGPIGICICYDIYSFPELARYYAAKGARLVLNPTAYAKSRGFAKGKTTLESTVLMNGIYVASANLCGQDLINDFWGGSSVIGPSQKMQDIHYYAGYPFGDERGMEQEMYMTTIDLSLAHRGVFVPNPMLERADFRPDIYLRLYKELNK